MPDLMTLQDVMSRYHIQRQAASVLMRKLPVIRIGGRLFVRKADLLEYEQAQTEYPVTAPRKTAPLEVVTSIKRRRT